MQKISDTLVMVKILSGKKIAEDILNNLKKEIKSRKLKVKLAVIWVGDDAASKVYIRKKREACKKIGAGFNLYHFKEKISAKNIEKEIKKITDNKENSGVIIQLPLPGKKDVRRILNLVPNNKDVDVLSEGNFREFSRGRLSIVPPTVGAILAILKEYKISMKNKYVVIVGAGRLVGKPLSAWMGRQPAKFSVLDKNTKGLQYFTSKADILISGVGKPSLIKGDMVKKGAVVIDVGGDVDFNSVSKKAGFITPVFGGVGPLTVACLLKNLVILLGKK